jgi:DnaJ family protein C protein 17
LADAFAVHLLYCACRVRAVNLEKKATHDEKRRHVYEDLVKREQAAEGLKEEESAKARLKAEIERMRQTAEARRPSSRPSPKPAAPQDTDALGRRGNSDEPLDDVSARTLKISWFRETTGVAYDEAQLRAIFSKYGAVEDIIMREGKKKKGSALITLMRQEDAKKALKTASGDPKNPLLVLPLCATEGKVGDRGRSKNETSQGISYKPLSMSPSSAKVGAAGSLGARPVKPLFPAAATRRSD